MESRIGMYFLFFLLLFCYISIAEGGGNSQSYSKDNEFFTNQNYNARTYNNGKDPNIRKNIEEMIKVMVQDSLPMAMETTEQKYDITTDIQVAVNEIIFQIALHASKLTQKIILQSGLKPNSTQAIHTELQHCEMIDYQNRNKEAKELADKVSLLLNVTKELTDTISLNNKQHNESAILDNNLTSSENKSDEGKFKFHLGDGFFPFYTSSENESDEGMFEFHLGDEFLTSSENEVSDEVKFEFHLDDEFPTKKKPSLCDVKVPISLTTKHNSWKYKKIPEMDDLDNYMINKTGCLYTAIEHDKQFNISPVFSVDGLEWRLAVRTRQEAALALQWDDNSYSFFIGQKNNTVSSLKEWSTQKIWEHSTPGLLSEDRYVPLYIKISNGKLTVGHECDSKPFITRDVPPKKEPNFHRSLKQSSPYGAKYLHTCPDGSIYFRHRLPDF